MWIVAWAVVAVLFAALIAAVARVVYRDLRFESRTARHPDALPEAWFKQIGTPGGAQEIAERRFQLLDRARQRVARIRRFWP